MLDSLSVASSQSGDFFQPAALPLKASTTIMWRKEKWFAGMDKFFKHKQERKRRFTKFFAHQQYFLNPLWQSIKRLYSEHEVSEIFKI